jgi:hypothetical protein
LQFSPGGWGWQQDTRIAYWSRNAKSSFNGNPGTFITIEGPARYNLGQFPTVDQPPIPVPRP